MKLSWDRRRSSKARPERPFPFPWPAPVDYALVEHPRLGVCCITECGDGFGVLWSWSGDQWLRHEGSIVEHHRLLAQSFRGVWDPTGDRILCCGLECDDDGSHAVMVAVSERGAEHVHDTGELPTGPVDTRWDLGCIFGADPSRGTCAVLGAERLWERDPAGEWRVAAEVEPGWSSKRWYPGSHHVAYDEVRARLVFHWLDWRDFSPRLLGWDGEALVPLSTAGLPGHLAAGGGGALASHPEHGAVLVFGGGVGIHALGDGETWQRIADADVPKFMASRALFASDDGALWVGPGTFYSPAGLPRPEQAFYRNGVRIGPHWLGPGSASSRRLLAWHAGELLEERGDWTAMASDGEHLWAIARDGSVSRRDGDAWRRMSPPYDGLDEAVSVAAATFSAGLIVVVERPDGEHVTLVWEEKGWREVVREAAPRRRKRKRKDHVPPRTSLLDDRLHQRTLRYDGGEAFVLAADGWSRVPALDVGHADSQPVMVYDPRTGRAVAVRLDAPTVLSIERDGARLVARLENPPPHLEPEAWRRERPLSADWTFAPEARELTLWVDDELDERFVLQLGPVFDELLEM